MTVGDHVSRESRRQDMRAGRDGYVAGNDLTINVHYPSGSDPSLRAVLVVGDVPQEPEAFQSRADLMEMLEQESRTRVSVVFAVTGLPGVGKTQVAAACARRRIDDRWRLVAWIDATDTASLLAGLAKAVRNWLEADGERQLVVFDNAADLDGLRPFVPSAGAAQVVITSNRQSASGLGTPVAVGEFTEAEALQFLAERTGLSDPAAAQELAEELGFLPLALAQAAGVISA